MTEKEAPWVGDQVYDADTGKECVVSDVRRDGTYILREMYSWALTWTVPNAEKLSVTVAREERIERERKA
ncbi:hypothetical protein [Streptomyces sp. NPDC058812]|uniref:hypothetical protein n=1 Tax=unclassified Streptomyces TaxID=2593676 RepID=UPI0036A71D65